MLNIDSILRVVICCNLFTITIDDSIYIIGDMSEDEEFIPDIFNHPPMKSLFCRSTSSSSSSNDATYLTVFAVRITP